jgi:hypothetical protein
MRMRERGHDGLVLIVDRACRITVIYGLKRSDTASLRDPKNRAVFLGLVEMRRGKDSPEPRYERGVRSSTTESSRSRSVKSGDCS